MRALFWFTADLRLQDNPALAAAMAEAEAVVPVYILDDSHRWAPGGATRWWLHHSLTRLAADITRAGGQLILRRGDPTHVLPALLQATGCDTIYCSRAYEPRLREIQQILTQRGCLQGFSGRLLFEPEAVRTRQGKPFRVFTPYYRAGLASADVPNVQPKPKLRFAAPSQVCDDLADWRLLPSQPDWAAGFDPHWQPGEAGALRALAHTVEEIVAGYAERRDIPSLAGTSRLSPHLAHGEISPWRVYRAVDEAPALEPWKTPFLRQLIWRNFSYHLLYHWPEFAEQSFQQDFRHFPWSLDPRHLSAWQRGHTGYPIVDAGMRQLWRSGWMHNRVRMITGSFLTKHLRLHWRHGAEWFWDCLVDADLANNSQNWQWIAGTGADAAPYFRIFNPIIQGKKFDPAGEYIKQWVPELRQLPARYIHSPWRAPATELAKAGVRLGDTYPLPVVEHDQAREAALAAYRARKAP